MSTLMRDLTRPQKRMQQMRKMYAIGPAKPKYSIAKFCKVLVHQFVRGLRLMISAWQQDPLDQVTVKIIYTYKTLRLELIDIRHSFQRHLGARFNLYIVILALFYFKWRDSF